MFNRVLKKKASTNQQFRIDQFSTFGRCVYIEGWINEFKPKLHYDGVELSISHCRVKRDDLAALFGDRALQWGFVVSAVLPSTLIDRRKFRFTLNNEIVIDYPAEHGSSAEDHQFLAMSQRFRSEVESKVGGSLLEVGSRARSGNSYRHWFPEDIEYVGLDVTAGPNVDIVGDAHHLSRHVKRRFDFIFSISCFEHILMPWKVAIEMNKVLHDGGLARIISHGAWPLHEEPWDFWRFSKEAWSGIFNKHTGFDVIDSQYQFPAQLVPRYINDANFEHLSLGRTYLISGCIVKKVAEPLVTWDAEVSDVYDLGYSHA